MGALAFSQGCHAPNKHPASIARSINSTKELPSPAIKLSNTRYITSSLRSLELKAKYCPTNYLFSRREAISLGFCFSSSLVEFLLPRPKPAGAAESSIIPPCGLTATPSGLAYCDTVVGYGSQAEKGQLIKAHYVGKLENGTVFDSSYNRGKPLTFRVGVGEVIKGWDQGILGGDGVPPMLEGGKRTLKLPPALGYGTRGAGCRGGSCIIPPDSVLLFEVEFIGKA